MILFDRTPTRVTAILNRFSQPLPIDAYRSVANPLWHREPRGVIEAVTPLTPTAVAIRIRTNRAWPGHRAGQFVTLGVEVGGVRHHRCYSITSPAGTAGEQTIEIAVQHVGGGLVSGHLTGSAAVGDVLHLGEPGGDFTLPTFVPDRLLFISGGSGVTPLIGMLRTLADRPPHTQVTVVHHAPTAEHTMFGAELSRLAAANSWLTLHLVRTREDGAHLSADRLDALCPDWRDRDAYVCGPSSLVGFVTDHWAEHHSLDRLHLERFTLDLPAIPTTDDSTVSASFVRAATSTTTSTGTTLLEAAESAGVAAPYGCRTGVCHTCSTRLVSGCTTDVRDGRVSEPGTHVQLCVSRPLTDVVLDV